MQTRHHGPVQIGGRLVADSLRTLETRYGRTAYHCDTDLEGSGGEIWKRDLVCNNIFLPAAKCGSSLALSEPAPRVWVARGAGGANSVGISAHGIACGLHGDCVGMHGALNCGLHGGVHGAHWGSRIWGSA